MIKHSIEACFSMDLLWIYAGTALCGAVGGKDRELVQLWGLWPSASMRWLAQFCFLLNFTFPSLCWHHCSLNIMLLMYIRPESVPVTWIYLLTITEVYFGKLISCIFHLGVHIMLCISEVHPCKNFSVALQARNGSNSCFPQTAS